MTQVILREAEPSDIESIINLEKQCFNAYTQESEEVYKNRMKYFPQGFIVLEDDGVLCGAVSSEIWNYKENISIEDFTLGHSIEKSDPSGDELYVSSLCVSPRYRGKNYGKRLLNELFVRVRTRFSKVTKGILLVNEAWTNAIRIYRDLGFEYANEFPNFFVADDGSERKAIVMRKTF